LLREAGLPEKPSIPLSAKPSIAVLPFENMSGDPEQEYFSDGITEDIITAISKTPKMFVIARNSTFTYKGKSVKVQEVGRDLGVRYVLEGSVRKVGDKVRITAQLIDAQTGHHLWAEKYDRNFENIFALQDEIVKKIITELRVELDEGEQARIGSIGTDNLEAYLKVLQGVELFNRFNRVDNIISRQRFEEAILIDPDYPVPYGFIALTHAMDVWLGFTKSPVESISKGIEFVQKAISLGDDIDIPHIAMARFYLLKRQHMEAIAEAKKGIYLNPRPTESRKSSDPSNNV